MNTLSRRRFVLGAGSAGLLAGCGRLPGQAEPRSSMPQIGYLGPILPFMQGFEEGLRDRGYVPGQNIAVQYALANRPLPESPDQWLAAASELAQSGVDVILVFGTAGAFAAKQATSTMPIVFANAADVVRGGLVASLARPGGNVTGVTNFSAEWSAKGVEALKAMVPNLACLAVLVDPTNPAATAQVAEVQRSTETLGLRLLVLEARGPEDFPRAFAAASQEPAEAMTIVGSPTMTANPTRLADLAAEHRLPAMYTARGFPEAGGLMAYGADLKALLQRTAYYVDRILKGTKPADLPVEQPMRFDFVVNLKTAQALGITFPNEIMLQVTEVIQ
jgi:putative tryptophan/tyrosine transport system substrate-binding protein